MSNYLSMDRASEAAARDLAEVRKLIEGMSAFVNQQQQQQQQQDTAAVTSSPVSTPTTQTTTTSTTAPLATARPPTAVAAPAPQAEAAREQNTAALMAAAVAAAAASQQQSKPGQPTAATTDAYTGGTVVQVDHLLFCRTLYFQLSADATIEPLVTGLRLSFNDSSISGMVLQYKGFDGLWKCLLNRDDSLKRILRQGVKNQTMIQMRVPREQDLLSSGYTDRRLLALTKPGA